MEDHNPHQAPTVEEPQAPAYEPPVVEDLDTTRGPALTAAGGSVVNVAAPRSL